MRTMQVLWTCFNVKCVRMSARDQRAGDGVSAPWGLTRASRASRGGEGKDGHVFKHVEMEWIQT